MNDTILYMLTENSPYMMSFVICTSKNNVIVIDGRTSRGYAAFETLYWR